MNYNAGWVSELVTLLPILVSALDGGTPPEEVINLPEVKEQINEITVAEFEVLLDVARAEVSNQWKAARAKAVAAWR
jgi:hypothetical protein